MNDVVRCTAFPPSFDFSHIISLPLPFLFFFADTLEARLLQWTTWGIIGSPNGPYAKNAEKKGSSSIRIHILTTSSFFSTERPQKQMTNFGP